jgi:hypothetical protein
MQHHQQQVIAFSSEEVTQGGASYVELTARYAKVMLHGKFYKIPRYCLTRNEENDSFLLARATRDRSPCINPAGNK